MDIKKYLYHILLRYLLFFKKTSGPTEGSNTIYERLTNHITYLFPELENENNIRIQEEIKFIINDFIEEGIIEPTQIKTFFFEYSLSEKGIAQANAIKDSQITDQFLESEMAFQIFLDTVLKGINVYGTLNKHNISDRINDTLDNKLKISLKEQRRIGNHATAGKLFDFFNTNGFLKRIEEGEYKFNKRGRKLIEIGNHTRFSEWENSEIEKEERRQQLSDKVLEVTEASGRITKRLLFANVVIAVGTGVAAFYYILSIQYLIKDKNPDLYHKLFPFWITGLLALTTTSIALGIWYILKEYPDDSKNM